MSGTRKLIAHSLLRFLINALLLIGTVCLLTFCVEPNVNHLRWEPLSEEEIVQAIERPSGKISREPPEEAMKLLALHLPAVIEIARFSGHLTSVVDDISRSELLDREESLPAIEKAPGSDEDEIWGTSLYLRLACPGDKFYPPYQFINGEARLDSPRLESLQIVSLLTEGQFLLSFDRCQLHGLQLDAQLRGRYFSGTALSRGVEVLEGDVLSHNVLALSLGDLGLEVPIGFVVIMCGSATAVCRNEIRVLVELNAGSLGTFVASFRLKSGPLEWGTQLSMLIRGADREASCAFSVRGGVGKVRCDASGD